MNQKSKSPRYGHDFIVAVRDPSTSRNFTVTMLDELDRDAAMRRACDRVAREEKIDPCVLQVHGCQQIDDDETPVIFRVDRSGVHKGSVTAVFPCEPGGANGYHMACYAHIGQHSGCSPEWYDTTRLAAPAEYADLKHELESAPYGYRLKVYSRMQPWMRDALREAVRKAVQS